jgi:hypothetical protein
MLGASIGWLEQARICTEQAGFMTRSNAIDRNSNDVRQALLKSLLHYFDYASHEWPAGILWGMDGATLGQ